jgi:hypothetical protein
MNILISLFIRHYSGKVKLLNRIRFYGEPAPNPYCIGDTNGDGILKYTVNLN